MIVLSSLTTDDHAQADGSIWVYETHVREDGTTEQYSYPAEAGLDYHKVMLQRASELNANELAVQQGG